MNSYPKPQYMEPISPWGHVQYVERLCNSTLWNSIVFISTASHGGVRVHDDRDTRAVLSKSCLKRAEKLGDYLYFEEDCDAALPLYELVSLGLCHAPDGNDESYKDKLYRNIAKYNPQYLKERGI